MEKFPEIVSCLCSSTSEHSVLTERPAVQLRAQAPTHPRSFLGKRLGEEITCAVDGSVRTTPRLRFNSLYAGHLRSSAQREELMK